MKQKVKLVIRIVLLILAVVLSLSLIRSITKIAGSNQKIVDAQVRVAELKKENEALNGQLQTITSTQFIQEQAHDKLGLANKGEIVVVLPPSDSLRALAPKIQEEKFTLPDPNWKKWLKLFL